MIEWVGFDLDDTLHDARRTVDRAHMACLEHLQQSHDMDSKTLKRAHDEARAMAYSSSGLSVRGFSATDSRTKRFQRMLELVGISDEGVIPSLLDIYARVKEDSMAVRPGANELLKELKSRGRSIAVISGGPEETRRMIVDKLGLTPLIDLLISSGGAGLAKTGGLFGCALDRMGVRAEDFPYIGDSLDQDITPALAIGIPAVWFRTEYAKPEDRAPDGVPTVSSLPEALGHLIGDDAPSS